MQAAITDFIRNDESVMKAIIDTVSNALVTKLIGNKSFIDALSQKLMDNGVLDSVKQSVYEANAMDTSRTYATVTAIETKLGDLNSHNNALSDEVDALEQYSRRNCLLLHGVPESSKDTTEAAIAVFNSRLDININNEHIDRSHRLGQPRSDTDSDRPRPIIVKFASYETRRRVFTAKRKLKGTKLVVMENLTKRRSETTEKSEVA